MYAVFRSVLLGVAGGLLAVGCSSLADEPTPPTTGDEIADMASCLREEGWDVTSHPDGSYSAEFPTEQREQFEAAEAQCAASLPNFDEPVTREQAEGYYDALLEAADCVRELGYHVDEPPSRQAAVEAIMQPIIDLGGWYPYTEAEMTASGDDLEEVYRACPPPSLY